MVKYRRSPPPVPRRRPRYSPKKADGPRDVGLFAGQHVSFAPHLGGWDFEEELRSQEPGYDASRAGEDAVPNDGDDQASEGAVRKPTGRPAARSSRHGDRPRSESRKIVLDGDSDVLRRLREVSERCIEPERYYLGVLVFPKKANRRLRLFADQMVPTTSGPDSPAAAPRGLKRPKRPRQRNE